MEDKIILKSTELTGVLGKNEMNKLSGVVEEKIWKNYRKSLRILEETLEKDVFKLRVGDELQQGVMKLAKVYIAQKRKVSVGDKMAGRHGNKGIVSILTKPLNCLLSPINL